MQLSAIPKHFLCAGSKHPCAGSQCHAPKYSAITQAADSRGSYKSAKPSEEKQGSEKLRSCLPLFRMGLNTPALAELGDRWAGQRAWRTCSTYFPHTEPSLRFQHFAVTMDCAFA